MNINVSGIKFSAHNDNILLDSMRYKETRFYHFQNKSLVNKENLNRARDDLKIAAFESWLGKVCCYASVRRC